MDYCAACGHTYHQNVICAWPGIPSGTQSGDCPCRGAAPPADGYRRGLEEAADGKGGPMGNEWIAELSYRLRQSTHLPHSDFSDMIESAIREYGIQCGNCQGWVIGIGGELGDRFVSRGASEAEELPLCGACLEQDEIEQPPPAPDFRDLARRLAEEVFDLAEADHQRIMAAMGDRSLHRGKFQSCPDTYCTNRRDLIARAEGGKP